jgi:hypothetical protein
MVIAEHEKKRESEIRKRYHEGSSGKDDAGPGNGPPANEGETNGT